MKFTIIFSLSLLIGYSSFCQKKVYPVIGAEKRNDTQDSNSITKKDSISNSSILDSIFIVSLEKSIFLCYNVEDIDPSGLRSKSNIPYKDVILGVGLKNGSIIFSSSIFKKYLSGTKHQKKIQPTIKFERYHDMKNFKSTNVQMHSDSFSISKVEGLESYIEIDESKNNGIHCFVELGGKKDFNLIYSFNSIMHQDLFSTTKYNNTLVFSCNSLNGYISIKIKGYYTINGVFISMSNHDKTKKKNSNSK